MDPPLQDASLKRKSVMKNMGGRRFGNLLPKVREDTLVLKERMENCTCINDDILNTCKQCRLDIMDYMKNNFIPKNYSRNKKTTNCFTGEELHHNGLIDRLMADIDRGVVEEDKKGKGPWYEDNTSDMQIEALVLEEDKKEHCLRKDTKLLYRREKGGLDATVLIHRILHKLGLSVSTETVLMGLVLLERIKLKRQDKGGLALCSANMRSLMLGVMMIVSKTHDLVAYNLKWWRSLHHMDLNERGIRFTELLLLRLCDWEVTVHPWQIRDYLFERGITMPFVACFHDMPNVTGLWHNVEDFQRKRVRVDSEPIHTILVDGQILVIFLKLSKICTFVFFWY